MVLFERCSTCARIAGAPNPDGSRKGGTASELASSRPNFGSSSQDSSSNGLKRFSN